MEIWVKLLAIIGVFTLIMIVFAIAVFTYQYISELIENLRYMYRYKHRFGKSPTAKCYCKDCKFWGYQGQCGKIKEWYTADCWFCWNAEPRDKEVEDDE